MVWYHAECVGICEIDYVGAWTCADCRVLPNTVKSMKLLVDMLLVSTKTISENIKTLSQNIESNFDNLNDRITVLANKQKCSDQASTSALADIHQDVKLFRSDVDKKTNSILSKSHVLIEKLIETPDLARHRYKSGHGMKTPHEKKSSQNYTSQDPITKLPISSPEKEPKQSQSDKTNGHFQNTNKSTKTKVDTRPTFTTRLTFITGSCILKHVKTKFLDENVRIKHFKNAKIDTLKDKLSKMDLAHYKQIVIHVGGHDVDANISQNSFRNKYKQLLDDITKQNSKVFVSGLLPRERKNMKPFNDILKTLCKSMNIEFIDNHDSFILASGEFPFEFFHADKINLKFAGIRALIQNIHRKCPILPKPNNAVSDRYTNTTRHNVRTFVPTTHTSSRREQSHIGSRRRPIWVY